MIVEEENDVLAEVIDEDGKKTTKKI